MFVSVFIVFFCFFLFRVFRQNGSQIHTVTSRTTNRFSTGSSTSQYAVQNRTRVFVRYYNVHTGVAPVMSLHVLIVSKHILAGLSIARTRYSAVLRSKSYRVQSPQPENAVTVYVKKLEPHTHTRIIKHTGFYTRIWIIIICVFACVAWTRVKRATWRRHVSTAVRLFDSRKTLYIVSRNRFFSKHTTLYDLS